MTYIYTEFSDRLIKGLHEDSLVRARLEFWRDLRKFYQDYREQPNSLEQALHLALQVQPNITLAEALESLGL